jgi:hypothetical protein
MVTNGMISGHPLTSLLDSLMSLGIAAVVTYLRGVLPKSEAFSGDDAGLMVASKRDAVSTVVGYAAGEVSMNAKKNKISRDADEFLRVVTTARPMRSFGYLGRAIGSVLFRNPLSPDRLSELDEIIGRWATLHARGLDRRVVLRWMVSDLMGRLGAGQEQVTEVLRTPRTLGGLGYLYLPTGGRLGIERVEEKDAPVIKVPVTSGSSMSYYGSAAARVAASQVNGVDSVADLKFVEVKDIWPLRVSVAVNPIKPIWKVGIDPMMGAIVLRERITDRKLRKSMSEEERYDLLENGAEWAKLEKRMSRSIFLDMLMGRLKVPLPSGCILSDTVVSMKSKQWQNAAVHAMQTMRKGTQGMWLRISLFCENELRRELVDAETEGVPWYK